MNKQNKQVEQAQTEKWEEEHQRVLSKAIPELLKITGKHSTLWNYSKLETIEKLSDLLSQVRQEAVEEERKSIKKHIYLMRKENTPERNETISEILYSIENEYVKALS